nr:MAG TPA: RecR protein [Caudoviricetes sp.]
MKKIIAYLRWLKWRTRIRKRLLAEIRTVQNKITTCRLCGNPCVPDDRIYDEILCPICANDKLNKRNEKNEKNRKI